MSALASAEDGFVPMRPDHLDTVAQAEREIYPFPWTRGNFRDALAAGNSAWLLVAGSGPLMGYAILMPALDEAHLLNLSIHPHYQGHGHGWRLLDFMAARARDFGARTMLLEVRPSNPVAQRLYERYGFERIGMRRGYYPAAGGREDAIVMRVML